MKILWATLILSSGIAMAQQTSSPPPVNPNMNGPEYAPSNGGLQEEEDLTTESEERSRRRQETDYDGTEDTPRKVRSRGPRVP